MPTTFDLTPEQISTYRRHAQQRRQQELPEIERRRERAWEAARMAAQVLKEKFGVKPVVQNGNIVFNVPQGEKFLPQLMSGFESKLLSIGLRRPTLDDVFLSLTGRAIRDEEAGMKDMMKQMMTMHGRRR